MEESTKDTIKDSNRNYVQHISNIKDNYIK
jgi:hypothetical protein